MELTVVMIDIAACSYSIYLTFIPHNAQSCKPPTKLCLHNSCTPIVDDGHVCFVGCSPSNARLLVAAIILL